MWHRYIFNEYEFSFSSFTFPESEVQRRSITTTAERITSMCFVVDRMHFRGHVDPWCRENCDPNKLDEMKKVSKCGLNFNMYMYVRI